MARGVTVKRVGQACVRTLGWMAVMVRNGRLPAGLGALAFVVALTFLMTDKRFTVNRVVVTGVVALPGATVAETTGVLGQSVFAVDSRAVAQRIAALPSIRRADVSTQAPGTLVVHVDERQAAIIWDTGNQSYLVDDSGVVVGQADSSSLPSLPHLRALAGVPLPMVGQRVNVDAVRAVLDLNTRMPAETGLTRAAIALDPVTGIVVQTEQGRIVMGNDELLGRKLAMLKLLLRDQSWTDLDVRDPDRPVLTKR